jgi:hypothetical protein
MLLDMAETEDDKTYGELDQANKLMTMEHICACLSQYVALAGCCFQGEAAMRCF